MTITLAVYCILPKLVWVLYNLLWNPCEGGELIVCLSLTVLCCTGTTRYCLVLGRWISESPCIVHWWIFHLSMLTCGQSLYRCLLCRTAVMVWFANLNSFYLVRTIPTSKVVVQAGPRSVWLGTFQVSSSIWTSLAVIDFTFENTMFHHFWIRVDVTNSNLSNAMVSGLSVSSLMNLRLMQVLLLLQRHFDVCSTVLNALAGTAS